MKALYIIGSGGFSKQVIEMVEKINLIHSSYKVIGIIDDNSKLKGERVLTYEILGDTNYLHQISKEDKVSAVIAIGDGRIRKKISNKLLYINWINLIHPKAIVSKYIRMGIGNIICAGAVINPMCTLGNHCNINIGCTMGHDIKLESFSTLMPGCNISGNVSVGRGAIIGTNSCVLQNKIIGEGSSVGAGAVVIDNVESYSLYVGIPAKKIKNIR